VPKLKITLSASSRVKKLRILDAKMVSKDAFFGDCWTLFHVPGTIFISTTVYGLAHILSSEAATMPSAEALESRLRVLEEEMLRLMKQASPAEDQFVQDNYWRLAQDLQIEARELRSVLRRVSEESSGQLTPVR
jgi:hypothetical protein